MNDETVKRYSLAEIALLGIFVLGLILAYMFVKVRHRILLSEPIPLTGSGLSVSMPTNPGWNFDSNWRYESDSSMVLIGQQQLQRNLMASIRWRYAVCSPALSAQEILQLRAKESDSRMGSIESVPGTVPMHYAAIYTEGSDYTLYLGIAPLDYGRHLELQIFMYQQFDLSYAEDLFRALSRGIVYEPPQQLQAGHDMVDRFWEDLKAENIKDSIQENAVFLIKSRTKQPIGYYYSHLSSIRSESDVRWQLLTRYYEHRLSFIESTLLFDGAQSRFTWKSKHRQAGAGRPRQYTLNYENNGMIDIETDFEGDRQMHCSAPLLPEALLGDFAVSLLGNEQSSLTVDILSASGFVVPTTIDKSNVQTAGVQSDQIAFLIKVNYLNNPYLSEELYYNHNKELIGRLERKASDIRLWERTTSEQLKRIFGDNFQPFGERSSAKLELMN